MDIVIDTRRLHSLSYGERGHGPVVYWMSREQRLRDNWGLLVAQQRALEHQAPLVIVFTLVDAFCGATERQFYLMLHGLAKVSQDTKQYGITFVLLRGNPAAEMNRFIQKHSVTELVIDFDPLAIKRQWVTELVGSTSIPITEVDGHNIVPSRFVSPKREFAAYTIRPKINRILTQFLTDFPPLVIHPYQWDGVGTDFDPNELLRQLPLDRSVQPVSGVVAGEDAAYDMLESFIIDRLSEYATARNNPVRSGQSGLSPWLHFGQLSPQRVALAVSRCVASAPDSVSAYLEELIVRRELSDNFCLYCPEYQTIDAAPEWARLTLERHRHDPRIPAYSCDTFDSAQTHDSLWNAAQRQLVEHGRIHGYVRMYWAKKILEWSSTPEEALATAIYLNDRYALDGRDPNGYAGIAWSILGVHDRAWGRRPVFGTIRYMSFDGCRRKFDVEAYSNLY